VKKLSKILVVRFSSIGDIVLTSPVLRCLKSQLSSELHFLTKIKYFHVIKNNPNIDKFYTISNSISEVLNNLEIEKYDLIIDLHCNLRSFYLSKKLRIKSIGYNKQNFKKLIFILTGVNFIKKIHVTDRYFSNLHKIGVYNDNLGLDFFTDKLHFSKYDISQKYIAWCIGASNKNKKLSYEQISKVCNKLDLPILLLGDDNDKDLGSTVQLNATKKNVINFCGELTLQESSYILKNSELVLTNDTGLMHIASAFNKKIISFWGCTKPILGFEPLVSKQKSVKICSKNTRPCSKHGKYCRISKNGCVKNIDSDIILKSIENLFVK